MRSSVTLELLQKSACARRPDNQHLFEKPKKQRKPRRPSKHVLWMKEQLQTWCQEKGYELKEEYRFHPARKWRTDFFIVELSICIEYEGIMSEKSRHTSKTGYAGDIEKYNNIQSMGLKLLRFTVLNYTNLITELEKNTKNSYD